MPVIHLHPVTLYLNAELNTSTLALFSYHGSEPVGWSLESCLAFSIEKYFVETNRYLFYLNLYKNYKCVNRYKTIYTFTYPYLSNSAQNTQDFLTFLHWPSTSTLHWNEALTVQTQHLHKCFSLHYNLSMENKQDSIQFKLLMSVPKPNARVMPPQENPKRPNPNKAKKGQETGVTCEEHQSYTWPCTAVLGWCCDSALSKDPHFTFWVTYQHVATATMGLLKLVLFL